jgi:hypothetical protein
MTPAWTDQGTLLLPVDPAAWPPLRRTLALDGIAFAAKRELHLTLVGRALGAEIAAARARDPGFAAALAEAVSAPDWSFRRTGAYLRLLRRGEGRGRHSIIRHSIIERVEMPAMAPLHARLGALLGRALPVPPPHVTLYTAGDARGIGLPDEASLARYAARRVDADELGFGDAR